MRITISYDSGSSCDETGRMVVPYGEARPLLGGGEHDHHHADHDDSDEHDDLEEGDGDDRYELLLQLCTNTGATLVWRWRDQTR